MKGYQIALIVSVAIFAVGIILSILFNALFLFFFLPIGFAWGFSRNRQKQSATNSEQQGQSTWPPPSSSQESVASAQFCTYCGARLKEGNLFCPSCGRPIEGRIHYGDLR